MSDVDTTSDFTAGDFTLTGWVTDYTFPVGGNDTWVVPVGTTGSPASGDFIFEWTAATTPTFHPSATPEPGQNIGIVDASGGAHKVQLTLTFTTIVTNLSLYNTDGTVDQLDADGTSTLTLGGALGESGTQLLADLRGLQVVDGNTFDFFDINFKLTDITAGQSTSFTETYSTACYAPGTRIATPGGEVAVEDLQIGDLVATVSGLAKPVKWIGRRSYAAAEVAEYSNLRPVVIRKGALGSGLPRRDLVVSPMHALLIDGAFVPVAALVNGVSILRRETAGAAEYIHIELDQHDAIFAEGAPAETFVDDSSRTMFDNASEYYDLYGFAGSTSGFAGVRIEQGYRVDAIRSRLAGTAARAAAPGALAGHVERFNGGVLEGWVTDRAAPTAPVELEVLVDGEIVATVLANRYRMDLDRAGLGGGCYGFSAAMPASVKEIARITVRRASDGERVAMPQRALVTA